MSECIQIYTTDAITEVKKHIQDELESYMLISDAGKDRAMRSIKAKNKWIDTTLRKYGISNRCTAFSNIMIKIFCPQIVITKGLTFDTYAIVIRNRPVSFFEQPAMNLGVGQKLTRKEAKWKKKYLRRTLRRW